MINWFATWGFCALCFVVGAIVGFVIACTPDSGQQVCAGCGEVSFCVWPVETDEPGSFECGCCGQMLAEFMVAFPLAQWPAIDGLVRFRDAKRALLGRAAVRRES